MEDELLDYIVFQAVCSPTYDLPATQTINVTAVIDNKIIGELEAIRLAEAGFDPAYASSVVDAFDMKTAAAYSFAIMLKGKARAARKRVSEYFESCGLIAILSISVIPEFRGKEIALKLLRYVRSVHSDMDWYAALQPAPLDHQHGEASFRAGKAALAKYYLSANDLGFEPLGKKNPPDLLIAEWGGSFSPP